MIEIYAFRHGKTEYNRKRLFHGQEDIPLNDKGIEDAKRVAEFCKKKEFTHILTSDLSRCVEVAEMVNEYHHVPLIRSTLLRERHLGVYQGKPYHDHEANHELALTVPKVKGGESLDDVARRLETVVDGIRKCNDNIFVLISHGTPLAMLPDILHGHAYNPQESVLLETGNRCLYFQLNDRGEVMRQRIYNLIQQPR